MILTFIIKYYHSYRIWECYCVSGRFCVLQTGPDGERALRAGKTLDLELGGLVFVLTSRDYGQVIACSES